ncbi:MAG: peptidylprolyl isomerase [Ectothiorhodospiraceae bacterium]|jgi:hypothetical protein
MRTIRNFLGEPLLQFLVLGGLLFAIHAAVTPEEPGGDKLTIHVTPERIAQLDKRFQQVWRRAPSEAEAKGLLQNYIREEVLYREALALGLDRNDPVVRNRLRLKLEFLADSGAQLLDPGDEALQAFLDARTEDYLVPARLAFRQLYLGSDPSREQIAAVRSAALKTGSGTPADSLGNPSILPTDIPLATARSVDGQFGKGFFAAVSDLPKGQWTGPVRSAYGEHLIRVERSEPARLPELAEIRQRVLRDWRVRRAEELRDEQYRSMRARYRVVIDEEMPQ